MAAPFDLDRFKGAQDRVYPQVLRELKTGAKRSHWMWYIFPQIAGLGQSPTAKHYAIASLDEARAYLRHPVLGARLRECAALALAVEGRTAEQVFPHPDHLKFRSSMTLFALADPGEPVFQACLDKFFGGEADPATLRLAGAQP